jgi:hypothetical protein
MLFSLRALVCVLLVSDVAGARTVAASGAPPSVTKKTDFVGAQSAPGERGHVLEPASTPSPTLGPQLVVDTLWDPAVVADLAQFLDVSSSKANAVPAPGFPRCTRSTAVDDVQCVPTRPRSPLAPPPFSRRRWEDANGQRLPRSPPSCVRTELRTFGLCCRCMQLAQTAILQVTLTHRRPSISTMVIGALAEARALRPLAAQRGAVRVLSHPLAVPHQLPSVRRNPATSLTRVPRGELRAAADGCGLRLPLRVGVHPSGRWPHRDCHGWYMRQPRQRHLWLLVLRERR